MRRMGLQGSAEGLHNRNQPKVQGLLSSAPAASTSQGWTGQERLGLVSEKMARAQEDGTGPPLGRGQVVN